MIKIINGKKYEVARGGCCSCAFNSDEGENECAYTEEVGGVIQYKCNLKLGEHYKEVRDDKNH